MTMKLNKVDIKGRSIILSYSFSSLQNCATGYALKMCETAQAIVISATTIILTKTNEKGTSVK